MSNICPACKTRPKHNPSGKFQWSYCKECKSEKKETLGKRQEASKIFCLRGKGSVIKKSDCIPGCNDACDTCEHNK